MASLRNLTLLISVDCLAAFGLQDATITVNDASIVVYHHNNGGEPARWIR